MGNVVFNGIGLVVAKGACTLLSALFEQRDACAQNKRGRWFIRHRGRR